MGTRVDSNVPGPARRGLARYGFLAVLGIALIELAAHGIMRARVPTPEEWEDAAAFVRARRQPRDLVVAAPAWADPLVRLVLGDTMGLDEAGLSDTARFDRVWALSIRGKLPATAPDAPPSVDRRFGEVRVLRWDLGPSPVRYDFIDHLPDAEVTVGEGTSPMPCEWRAAPPRGGALGAGAYVPSPRFICDPRSPVHWVGATITEDLDLEPRHCIHQHPAALRPVRATFRGVPGGTRLVLYAGLYYEDERNLEGAPFTMIVRREGVEIGRMVHRDGDGWKRMEVALDGAGTAPASFAIETAAPSASRRSVCWSASIRGPRREPAE